MKYLLNVEWYDTTAEWGYYLEVSTHPDRKHSCYSCYDDWAFMRRRCAYNQGDWTRTGAYGNEKWAKRISNHYGISMPDRLDK